ncbi:MAG: pseudaminic acid synthase, partial [Bacteriovoracaceae bacterium]
MEKKIKIGNIEINEHSPAFIIAELSANHNQNKQLAFDTIYAMKESGADAVKVQTYTADTITLKCEKDDFLIKQGTIWDGAYLHDLYLQAYTPWEWHKDLQDYAVSLGLEFFSSPFDTSAVDLLESLSVPCYKIASFEITDLNLIDYVARKKKPVIISTGIARLEDISLAVETCKNAGNEQVILLKCTSSYPAPIEEANLLTIPHLASTFDVISGLSDHTMGSECSIASIALGGKVIEKHFILDRALGGPDSKFSMNPQEFKSMVNSVRMVESALGKVSYDLSEKQINSRQHSRSLYFVKDIKKGELITSENLKSIRPGFGLHPKYLNDFIGKKARLNIERGTRASFSLIE